jgi:membrane protease YdiL (CAAX protease family)
MHAMRPLETAPSLAAKPGAWNELALTLPVFLVYQMGVVFLHVRNATDMITAELLELAHGDRLSYLGLTAGIGFVTATVFAVLGRGQSFSVRKLVQIALEGTAYAIAMGTAAGWVVGKLFAGPPPSAVSGPFTGVVMSFGAGFYEELAFRALLFGFGAKLLVWLFGGRPGAPTAGGTLLTLLWAVVSAAIFSGMHYLGPLGDAFDMRSFVARGVLGLALTLVYATRGFAAAVWTHALYDVWVLAL